MSAVKLSLVPILKLEKYAYRDQSERRPPDERINERMERAIRDRETKHPRYLKLIDDAIARAKRFEAWQ
jgi:hypothetical protein